MTRALAQAFERVIAIEISGEMVRLATDALHDFPGVRVLQNNGTRRHPGWRGDLEDEAVAMAERCGFEARYRVGAGTQYFWLWFFRR